MATYEARIKFLKATGVILGEYEKATRNMLPELFDAVKLVNVSSAYAVYNRAGNTATEVNSNVRIIATSLAACLAELRKNNYNVGEFTDMLRDAANAVDENTPGTFEFTEVSVNSDGNEHMNQANLDRINEIMDKFMLLSSTALLDVSDARGPMKGESNAAIENIGTNLENFTNSVVLQCRAIIQQVCDMGVEYGLEIKNIEAATEGLNRISATDVRPEISFAGGEI